MPTNDAVLTWHTDPWTCGVAKFNTMLAQRIGVPVVPWKEALSTRRPLVSMKPSEVDTWAWEGIAMPYDLFLHGVPREADRIAVIHASRVFAANQEIYQHVCQIRSDVSLVFVPSLLEPTSPADQLTLFSFGMAHKLTRPYFERVRDLLGDRPYVVELSVALHEGQPWGEAAQQSTGLLREVFGDRGRFLGSLSDRLIKRHLRLADWVLLFYPGGLRANNTTFWAAKNEGARILTNMDAYSPFARAWNIDGMTAWPTDEDGMWTRLVEGVA